MPVTTSIDLGAIQAGGADLGAVQTAPPVSISIAPAEGSQWSTVTVTVTGTNTHFSGVTVVSVSGSGVTAGTPVVSSSVLLTVVLTLSGGAPAGDRTITVTTGAEAPTATFTVIAVPVGPAKPVAIYLSNIDESNYVLVGRTMQPVEWTTALDQTGSARWTMGGINGPWIPRVGQFFVIYDTGVPGWGGEVGRIMAGSIDSVEPETPIITTHPDYLQIAVTGSSLEYTLQRRLVRPDLASTLFKNKTCGEIAFQIATDFLVDDGLIIEAANFEDGPEVEFLAFNYQTVAECFTQLAEYAEFHWYVRPDGRIYFQPREAVFAPWGIADGATYCDRLTIRESRENLSNAVYVRTLFGAPPEDVITTTAGQRFFETTQQIAEILNLAQGPIASRVPVEFSQSDGTDKPFWFTPGDNGFSLTTGVADLPAGTILSISYHPLGGDVVANEDATSIGDRAVLEGTSGRYELAVGASANTSRATAESRASMIIQQRRNIAHVVDGETRRGGLAVGQALVISTMTPPINDTFLLTDVSGHILPGTDQILYRFVGVNGPKLPSGWDFFTGQGDTGFGGGFGAGFSTAAQSSAGASGSGGGGSAILVNGVLVE